MVFMMVMALVLGGTLTTAYASDEHAAAHTKNHVQNPVQSIAQLRKEQQTASYSEYFELERAIDSIKHEHNARVSAKRTEPFPTWILSWIHLFPFIFWQLIALASALLFFVVRCRSIALGVVMALATTTVWAVYQERSHQWLVISEPQKKISIGPGSGYPVSGELAYLDEVLILSNKKNNQEQWYKVHVGDRIGWIQSDVGGV